MFNCGGDMKNTIGASVDLILHKNIQNNLPLSEEVDSRTFSRLLKGDPPLYHK
jgi:hypothetical protein